MIFPQGGARLYNIHDHIGEAQQGSKLDGTVQFDDINVPALGGVVSFGNIYELGGYPQRAAWVVHEVLGARHAHAAPA